MENRNVLEARGLSIGYAVNKHNTNIIHSFLDVSLRSGEVTSLLGLNGAGKSTLLRTLCGFQPAIGGDVFLNGKPLASYSQAEFALTVGVVLTEKTNAGGITVEELVSLGRHPYTGFFGKLHEKDHEAVRKAMKMVGIYHKASNYVAELSDGERQKAMIAKALAQECPIIILDEPTSFLDMTSRIEIMTLLHKLAEDENKAILLSTHDIELAIQLSDSLWLLDRNQGIKSGSPEDLILSGALDGFFDKDDITFDAATGKFSSSKYIYKVRIEGETIIVKWTINALARNHYDISKDESVFPLISCKNHSNIVIINSDGTTESCDSIENLMERLKRKKASC
jgi:iron complex transport system ATP-binding protein